MSGRESISSSDKPRDAIRIGGAWVLVEKPTDVHPSACGAAVIGSPENIQEYCN